jgi:hypothetical protein
MSFMPTPGGKSNLGRWPWTITVVVILVIICSQAPELVTACANLIALLTAVIAYRAQQRSTTPPTITHIRRCSPEA